MNIKSKKTFRGFTLVEVIVAMAILAIASMVMALMYASISKSANQNNQLNDRMSEQQQYVEHQQITVGSGSNVEDIVVSAKDKELGGTEDLKFEIYCTYNAANTNWVNSDQSKCKNFVVNCEVYELMNMEDGKPVPASNDEDDLTVNFKYFVGSNTVK